MRAVGLGLVAMLFCAGCQTNAPHPPAASAPAASLDHRAVMMNGFYMGRLTSHWRIEADGTGEYWREASSPAGAPGGPLEKYRGHLPAAQRAALLATVARFRSGAVRRPPCRDAVHDAPSLAIRWGAGAREVVDAYLGCVDARSRAYAQQVVEMDAIVTRNFVRDGPPFAVEQAATTPPY